MRRPAPRGQNLVLLALTMLFLVLMVTMTIGLGLRVRQAHELQNLADTAAFSNAVMVARAHNNSALINRLQVSYFVSQTANQSLISWTSYGWGMTNAASDGVANLLRTGCTGTHDEGQRAAAAILDARARHFFDRRDLYEKMDGEAGVETHQIQIAISALRLELRPSINTPAPDSVLERLYEDIQNERITRRIVSRAGLPGVSVVSSTRDINRREVDCDFGGTHSDLNTDEPPGPGLCSRATWNENQLEAVMGSRGSAFVTGRGVNPELVIRKIDALLPNDGSVRIEYHEPEGSGYFAPFESHGNLATTKELWADDHGAVTVTLRDLDAPRTCVEATTVAATAFARSTHWIDTGDRHDFSPGAQDGPDERFLHTLGDCTPLCPSVWVRSLGFNPSDDANDAYGAPKQVVVLERDLNAVRYPWELHFNFKFDATGAGQDWDARGLELRSKNGQGLDISRATAMSTGIAYYHRADHWNEFPNLLNPFWRATLAPSDVDTQGNTRLGGTDVRSALGGRNHQWQRSTYDELLRAGYRGLH